uniref:PKNOX2-like protein n=1 Tax=Hofstenia miamia TaxID=442651 RepID=A0A5P8I4L6_HOFMI|nr:PKNOX2-like protein [Hofstenia miamia]
MMHVQTAPFMLDPGAMVTSTGPPPPPSILVPSVGNTTTQNSLRTSTPLGGNATPVPNTAVSGTSLGITDSQSFETDKNYIYGHPLFPLMALLFDKCEQATNSVECPSSASFEIDIETFIHQQERERKPFFTENAEVDSLMIKAIQVLRIHLLELEKVNELCKDFCQRYIACLKGKMHSENILRTDIQVYPQSSSPNSMQVSPMQSASTQPAQHQMAAAALSTQQLLYPPLTMLTPAASHPGGPGSLINSAGAFMHHAPVVTSHSGYPLPAHVSSLAPMIHGGASQLVPHSAAAGGHLMHPQASLISNSLHDLNPDGSMKKTKRGVLPKQATQIMRSWLFQHIVHPYPTEDEKRQLAQQTSLTLLQVNNWFINARRRILQPMLEATNPDTSLQKAKKSKTVARPNAANRFWPDNLAQGQVAKIEPSSPNDDLSVGSSYGPDVGNSISPDGLSSSSVSPPTVGTPSPSQQSSSMNGQLHISAQSPLQSHEQSGAIFHDTSPSL